MAPVKCSGCRRRSGSPPGSASSRREASKAVPRASAYTILGFFQRGFFAVGQFASDTVASISELRRLRENYEELSAKLDRKHGARTRRPPRGEQEAQGPARFLAGYRVPAQLAARIVAKDPENLYSTITIDKGFKDGIRKNMPVIAFQEGLEFWSGGLSKSAPARARSGPY